jgi:hypothetical protein
VNNSSPVTDISSLKNLKIITGDFTLRNVSQLKSLGALSNLERIDGDISITEKISLTDFTGLEKLTSIKKVNINTSNSEISFKGFGKNIRLEQLFIMGCNELKRINNLESLGNIQNINIQGNPNLMSIGNMTNINIQRQLVISNCPNLTTIGKINSANQHAAIHILSTNIEDLSCLSNINKLGQLLVIQNLKLEALNTENLTNVNYIIFHTNPNLKTLKGLENCQITSVSLQNNVRLDNIEHLKNMKKCHSVVITDNPSLKSIDVLSDVGEETTFFSYLSISGNIILKDLCPLSKVVKKLLKARETNQHVTLPYISNNGTDMTIESMIKTCP